MKLIIPLFMFSILNFSFASSDSNQESSSSLFKAAEHGSDSEIKGFIDKGVDVNALNENGETALHLLFKKEKYMPIKAQTLIKNGASANIKNDEGKTPLHLLTLIADESELERFIVEYNNYNETKGKKLNINLADKNGESSLVLAVKENKPLVARVLIKAGANVNTMNNDYSNLLHFVKDAGLAWDLVKKEVEVSAQNKYGISPLHDKAFFGNTEVAKLLMKNGADINAKDQTGFTALHYAADGDQIEIIKLLAEHPNIDLNALDEQKRTFMDIILQRHGFIKYLKYKTHLSSLRIPTSTPSLRRLIRPKK